jgi:hypothetical protein
MVMACLLLLNWSLFQHTVSRMAVKLKQAESVLSYGLSGSNEISRHAWSALKTMDSC